MGFILGLLIGASMLSGGAGTVVSPTMGQIIWAHPGAAKAQIDIMRLRVGSSKVWDCGTSNSKSGEVGKRFAEDVADPEKHTVLQVAILPYLPHTGSTCSLRYQFIFIPNESIRLIADESPR